MYYIVTSTLKRYFDPRIYFKSLLHHHTRAEQSFIVVLNLRRLPSGKSFLTGSCNVQGPTCSKPRVRISPIRGRWTQTRLNRSIVLKSKGFGSAWWVWHALKWNQYHLSCLTSSLTPSTASPGFYSRVLHYRTGVEISVCSMKSQFNGNILRTGRITFSLFLCYVERPDVSFYCQTIDSF